MNKKVNTPEEKKLTKKQLQEHLKRVRDAIVDPNGSRDMFKVPTDPNFEFKWIVKNDPNRPYKIETYKKAGWELVNREEYPDLNVFVGSGEAHEASSGASIFTRDGRNGLVHVLMRIPKELFELNQKVKSELSKGKILDGNDLLAQVVGTKQVGTVQYQYTQGKDLNIEDFMNRG